MRQQTNEKTNVELSSLYSLAHNGNKNTKGFVFVSLCVGGVSVCDCVCVPGVRCSLLRAPLKKAPGRRRRRRTETGRGQTDAGQRQQATAPQPAARPQEGNGSGGAGCEKGRKAKPQRDEHREQATARGAVSRRYPGKLSGAIRVPQGATPVTLRMQALTAARFDDILAHVTFTGTGSKEPRIAVCIPCGIRPG